MKRLILLFSFFLMLVGSSCQTDWEVGTSSVSIEPTNETISLTLAGYASPYDGRFTLTWDEWKEDGSISFPTQTDMPPGIISLTCDESRFYGLTADNILLQRSKVSDNDSWEKIGYKNDVSYTIVAKQITWQDGSLYAMDENNRIYKARHHTVGDLTARAMSIQKGKEVAVIVGVDVCGFDKSFTDHIKEELFRKRGIRKEAIMINASHTHFAPVTQSWITWQPPNQRPDSLYLLNVVRPAIIRSVEEALDNMKPSDLYFGRGTTEIGANRKKIKEYDIYDNTLDVIVAVSKQEKKKTILFMAGCHPVFTDPEVDNFTINANFPGYAKELIEKEADIENSIFLQAFAGDINPKDPFRKSGQQLANDVLEILKKGKLTPIKGSITCFTDTVAIPITPWSKEEVETFKIENLTKTGDMLAERNVRWANLMLEHYARNEMPEQMPVYYQTFNIGDWKLVALSREVTTEFGMAIREIWPNRQVSAIAYTNDVPSYLGTDPHILARNYEGYDSFFWYGQATCFPLKTFDVVIQSIKETNH